VASSFSAARSSCNATALIGATLVLIGSMVAATRSASAAERPTAEIMEPIRELGDFMALLPEGRHATMFAVQGVTVIENYPPFIFSGADAVMRWEAGFRQHAAEDRLSKLKVVFGPAQDFSVHDNRAYLSLPTTWTGFTGDKSFEEHGAWAFVLTREGRGWRILGYGWGVTRYSESSVTPAATK
jgi:hypothetical protein